MVCILAITLYSVTYQQSTMVKEKWNWSSLRSDIAEHGFFKHEL